MPQIGEKAQTRATQKELETLLRTGIGGRAHQPKRPRPSKRRPR